MTDNQKTILRELVDVLQAANLRATHLRQALCESADDAIQLEAATDQAVRLIKRLQPNHEGVGAGPHNP